MEIQVSTKLNHESTAGADAMEVLKLHNIKLPAIYTLILAFNTILKVKGLSLFPSFV